jgi:hypothetical protein
VVAHGLPWTVRRNHTVAAEIVLREQLAWRGPNGRAMGHVVLTREKMQVFLEEFMRIRNEIESWKLAEALAMGNVTRKEAAAIIHGSEDGTGDTDSRVDSQPSSP